MNAYSRPREILDGRIRQFFCTKEGEKIGMSVFGFGKKIVHEIHELDAEGVARHPHQHRRLILFGLLIGALSLAAGFTLIQNERSSAKDLLTKIGAKSMSSTDLKKTISALTISWKPYWLGTMSGFQYAADTSEPDEILIRYIRSFGDSSIEGKNIYTVESYPDSRTYDKDVLTQDSATDSEFMVNDRTGRYLSASPTFLVVRIAGNGEVFEIHALQPQSLAQLETMATSLVPVS